MLERLSIPADGVELRPAEDHEFSAVAALFHELHEFNAQLDVRFRLAERWEELLRIHFLRTHTAPGALWLLAWADTTPVGLLLMEAHNDSPLFVERRWAELVALYVAPSHRGSDLGTRLVDVGKAWAAAYGFDRMQLYVTASNEHAQAFYRRCGLAPVQEIWRVDLEPASGVVLPDDPSHVAEKDDDPPAELGHHQLAMELAEDERPSRSASD